MARGGSQRIPRPALWTPGPPPPWIGVDPDAVTLARIVEVFEGRQGAPASVEGRRGVRRSAVLAAFYAVDGEVHVLAIRRSWDLRTHRGEVSFPGGGEEPGDPNLVATALREAHEEVGLKPEVVDVLGELDHLTTVSSDRFIVPVVARLDRRPEGLAPDPVEVEAILELPLRELLHPEAYREERWGSIDFPVSFFEVEGDTIWGATAAMLRQFFTLLLVDPSGVHSR